MGQSRFWTNDHRRYVHYNYSKCIYEMLHWVKYEYDVGGFVGEQGVRCPYQLYSRSPVFRASDVWVEINEYLKCLL